MSNAVALKAPTSSPYEEIDLSSTFRACTVCARLLNADIRGGTKITHLAAKLKMAPQTISRIISRDTKEPRWSTIYHILIFYGFKVIAVKA